MLYRYLFTIVFSGLMLLLLIIFPEPALQAARHGLSICYQSVLPSLLPFFFAAGMLANTPALPLLGRFFNPVMQRVFRQRGEAGAVWCISWLCGYPMGAKMTGDLICTGDLNAPEAESLMALVNTCGPAFMLSAVGAGMLGSPTAGAVICIAHLLGAILCGIAFSRRLPRPSHQKSAPQPGEKQYPSFSEAIAREAQNAITSLLKICALIVIFCVLMRLLDEIHASTLLEKLLTPLLSFMGASAFADPAISGLLEMTQGASAGALAEASLTARTVFCCFTVSFGGLCIFTQAASCLRGLSVRLGIILLQKLLHAAVASVICYGLCAIMLPASLMASTAGGMAPLPYALCLLPSLLVVLIGTIGALKSRRGTTARSTQKYSA